MDNELFGDLMQSLNEALEYTKGDKSKGRSIIVDAPEYQDIDQRLWYKIIAMPELQKQKLDVYADEFAGIRHLKGAFFVCLQHTKKHPFNAAYGKKSRVHSA